MELLLPVVHEPGHRVVVCSVTDGLVVLDDMVEHVTPVIPALAFNWFLSSELYRFELLWQNYLSTLGLLNSVG